MARDAAEIIDLGLPVFCRGVTPNSAFPSGPGEVGLPIAMGEVMIDAGDLVVGDRDGVVVVPRAQLAEVTARLELVAAREAEMHARVAVERFARCWNNTWIAWSRSLTSSRRHGPCRFDARAKASKSRLKIPGVVCRGAATLACQK